MVRRLRSLFPRRSAVILLYHRVAELAIDPWGLAVSVAHFDQQLNVLARHAAVFPLRELLNRVSAGTAPRRSVAVTFDDGYADNLLTAKPLLERHATPATVFATTGALAGVREFWWDELEALLLSEIPLPTMIELEIQGERCRWTLSDVAGCGAVAGPSPDPHWRAWLDPPTSRHAVFVELWRRLQLLRDAPRQAVINALWEIAARTPEVRRSHRTLSAVELRQLACHELVDIGAHTVTHSRLSALGESEQRMELADSRRSLEGLLDIPVTMVSYPFGGGADFTELTMALAREVGFSCAFAAEAGPLRAGENLFRIPRCLVPDVDGGHFENLLNRWFVRADQG